MPLTKLQHSVIHALFDKDLLAQTASEFIQSDARLSAEQRLEIYRHSVQGILLQHLRAVFGVVEQLVGVEFFEYLTEIYIDQSPPIHTALSEYGAEFSTLLLEHPALMNMPWIAAVARLEWARVQAWHGVNQAPSDFGQLSRLSADEQGEVMLQLPTSYQLVESPYAIHEIWLAHQPEDYEGKPLLENVDLHVRSCVLIYRLKKQLHHYALNHEQAAFVQALQQGQTLNQLGKQFGEYLPQILPLGLQQGWMYAFTHD